MRLSLLDRGPAFGYEDEDRRSPWTRPGFVLSAVFVLVIAAMAGWLLLTDPPAQPQPRPAPEAPQASGAGCEMDPADAPQPPTDGAQHDWVWVGRVQAPADPVIGPARVDELPVDRGPAAPLRSCYAPGDAGALFAAAGFLAALSNPALVEPAVVDLAADSAGRDTLLDAIENTPERVNAAGAAGYEFVGYRFLTSTDDQATVSLALRRDDGALGQALVTVVWEEGDWKVVPSPDGRAGGGGAGLTSLRGYVPWGAP